MMMKQPYIIISPLGEMVHTLIIYSVTILTNGCRYCNPGYHQWSVLRKVIHMRLFEHLANNIIIIQIVKLDLYLITWYILYSILQCLYHLYITHDGYVITQYKQLYIHIDFCVDL